MQGRLEFSRDVFDVPVPANHSHASRQAAERLTARGVQGRKMARLLAAFDAAGRDGLTRSEAEAKTGLPVQSLCSLTASAKERGWLVPTGERPGRFGYQQTVCRITRAGERALADWRARQ